MILKIILVRIESVYHTESVDVSFCTDSFVWEDIYQAILHLVRTGGTAFVTECLKGLSVAII